MASTIIPNTFIAGFPRSGTSSLWYWLSAHPDVCASSTKETYYLFNKIIGINKNANYLEHGWEAFHKHFTHYKGEKVIFEATPVYFNRQMPMDLMADIHPLPKVLFLVREPSQRIFSFYRYQKYRQKNIDKTVDFNQFLEERKAMLKLSNYMEQIQPWLDKLGQDHIGVFLMEELLNESQAFMTKVCQYLDIDPAFYESYPFPVGNPSVQIKNQWLHELGLKVQRYIPNQIKSRIINPIYLKLNAEKNPAPTQKDLDAKERLREEFEPYNRQLAQVFNLDLSYWEKDNA